MRVLLSIKPKYAELIFDGTKKYEFRRTMFKNKQIKTVVVYASSPTQKVIGEFEIESIINTDLDELWESTRLSAGIEKENFYQYFANKESGFAIQIKSVKRYDNPLCLKDAFNLNPPQSFLYLNNI